MGRHKRPRQKDRFAMIPLHVIEGEEWHALNHGARVALIAVAAQFNGRNNGDLSLTETDGRRLGLPRSQTRSLAINACHAAGLIVKTRQGGMRPMGPTCWALPWHPLDYRNGKQLDQAVPAHVWIHETWASQNQIDGNEKRTPSGTKNGPVSGTNGNEKRTTIGPLTGTKTGPPSKTLPRGSASLASQEYECYERSEKREMKR